MRGTSPRKKRTRCITSPAPQALFPIPDRAHNATFVQQKAAPNQSQTPWLGSFRGGLASPLVLHKLCPEGGVFFDAQAESDSREGSLLAIHAGSSRNALTTSSGRRFNASASTLGSSASRLAK
jgi:hypothetical protein